MFVEGFALVRTACCAGDSEGGSGADFRPFRNSGVHPGLDYVLEMKEQVETAPFLVHRPTVNILTHCGCGFSALSSVYRLNPWSQSKELDRQVENAKYRRKWPVFRARRAWVLSLFLAAVPGLLPSGPAERFTNPLHRTRAGGRRRLPSRPSATAGARTSPNVRRPPPPCSGPRGPAPPR